MLIKDLVKYILKVVTPPSICTFRLGKRDKKSILLTFDDGPSPKHTSQVMDVLEEFDAKALFFMIGSRAEKNPTLVNEVLKRGHQIGNHSFSHPLGRLSFSQWVEEMQKCQESLFRLTGVYPKWVRPVRGDITLSVLLAARQCELRMMHWTLNTEDYGHLGNQTMASLTRNFIERIKDRSIVLAHDDHDITGEFLKVVLPKIRSMDYELRSVG